MPSWRSPYIDWLAPHHAGPGCSDQAPTRGRQRQDDPNGCDRCTLLMATSLVDVVAPQHSKPSCVEIASNPRETFRNARVTADDAEGCERCTLLRADHELQDDAIPF